MALFTEFMSVPVNSDSDFFEIGLPLMYKTASILVIKAICSTVSFFINSLVMTFVQLSTLR